MGCPSLVPQECYKMTATVSCALQATCTTNGYLGKGDFHPHLLSKWSSPTIGLLDSEEVLELMQNQRCLYSARRRHTDVQDLMHSSSAGLAPTTQQSAYRIRLLGPNPIQFQYIYCILWCIGSHKVLTKWGNICSLPWSCIVIAQVMENWIGLSPLLA